MNSSASMLPPDLWPISAAALAVVMGACLAGIFWHRYEDNMLQRLGLIGIFLGCAPRLAFIVKAESVGAHVGDEAQIALHVGLGLFALGAIQKMVSHARHERAGDIFAPTSAVVLAALTIAMLLWPGRAMAADQDCEPKTQRNPAAPGSAAVEFWSLDGMARWWWCPAPVPTGGDPAKTWWKPGGFGGLWTDGWAAVQAAAPRVLAASSPWSQFKAEAAAIGASMPAYPVGSVDDCRRKAVHRGACLELVQANMGPALPGPMSAASAAAACPVQPECAAPTPTPSVYKVPAAGSAVYPVVNGMPGKAIAGKRAPGGALCGAPLISAYGYLYGPYPGGAAGEVALCQKQP